MSPPKDDRGVSSETVVNGAAELKLALSDALVDRDAADGRVGGAVVSAVKTAVRGKTRDERRQELPVSSS